MEVFLLIVILAQLAFLAYSDYQNRLERDKLQMKLMAKDLSDYSSALEKDEESTPAVEEDEYIDIQEANIEQILRSRDSK